MADKCDKMGRGRGGEGKPGRDERQACMSGGAAAAGRTPQEVFRLDGSQVHGRGYAARSEMPITAAQVHL